MDTPYRHWQRQTRRLLEPLAALMHPGRADLSIAGPASDHDAQADRLESFARPLLLAAHYLQSVPEENGTAADSRAFRQRLAQWFRESLVAGSNPRSPQYFGPDASYHQHHVEMGLLSVALQIAPRQLWDPLEPAEKDQVAAWLATSRGSGIVNNNHLFMSVHILEFLGKHGYGHRTDRVVIAKHLDQLETMHRGGGWFEDGINQAFDHYNAYAFHFYGLWWARLHGAGDSTRAQRWREWARMFVNDYHHFFAASGEHPAFGRSIMYRFNAINVFGLAAAEGCTDVPLGRLRRLCTRSLDFFLARPITQEQGCLAFGWTDHFNDLAESYSCAASPYWCAKGLAALLLPPDHAFWTAPEQPLAVEQGDFVHLIPSAGLTVRGIGGEVEILNAGSMVSNSQLRYGAWKWSKLAYRTGVSFTLSKGPPPTDWSFDNALTQQLDDGRIFGRHSTVCVEMDREHLGYAYSLGLKTGQVNTGVETYLWWRAGWLLSVHLVDARQPVVLRLGGYALPLSAAELPSVRVDADLPLDRLGALSLSTRRASSLASRQPTERPEVEASLGPTATAYSTPLRGFAGARGTVLQPLLGFVVAEWDNRLDESTKRTHIHAPYHATPVAKTGRLSGRTALAALAWTGSSAAEAAPWTIVNGAAGHWEFSHPTLTSRTIEHWSLPALPLSRPTP